MNLNYLTIGVKGYDIQLLNDALSNLEIFNVIEQFSNSLRIDITIEDLRIEYQKITDFLQENNLDDENPFFNDFDINAYGLQVSFNFLPTFEMLDITEPLVFILGKYISSYLKTECIVMFENMRTPVGLFDKGVLKKTFDEFNSSFFANRSWRPNRII